MDYVIYNKRLLQFVEHALRNIFSIYLSLYIAIGWAGSWSAM